MSSEQSLYIVATPIGNRDDLSARAVAVLSSVDRIYVEDTRHSQALLKHYGVTTPVSALHEHNEQAEANRIAASLSNGGSAALISDAGTPLISDPGYRLVRACRDQGVLVSPIPGASALTAALSVSGLPTDRFQFVGFPPSKANARQQFLQELAALPHTVVLYESPHRIVACLADLVQSFGPSRDMVLARELTKKFETVRYGSIADIHAWVEHDSNQQRGEFVLMLAGKPQDRAGNHEYVEALDKTLKVLSPHLPVKTVARCAAELVGVTRKQAYDRALFLKSDASKSDNESLTDDPE